MAENKQIAVIGLGRFGTEIAKTLTEKGCEVLVIDRDQKQIEKLSFEPSQSLIMDTTDEEALKAAGIKDFDVVIVSIGENVANSALTAMLVKELGVKTIVARALNETHAKILQRIGCDRIILPEKETAVRLAEGLVFPQVLDYVEISPKFSMIEIDASDELINKTVGESILRTKYNVNIVVIKRKVPSVEEDGRVVINEIVVAPKAETKILEGDKLYIIGSRTELKKIEKLKS